MFLFATDPPNVVEHYDGCLAAMQERFPDSEMVIFELPGFGMSHSSRSSIDELAEDLSNFVRQVKDEHPASKMVLVMPCVSALFCPLVLPGLPHGTVEHLVVVQCADYAGELRWANGVNTGGMLSLPGLARLYNYVNAKAISAQWYKATFPKRGSYHECAGCQEGGSAGAGALQARSWFSSVAARAFDAGARFPLAWCLQRLFYAPPRQSNLVHVLRDGGGMIEANTLVVWGMQDGSHRSNLADEKNVPSFARYVSAPLVRKSCFSESAHFPELQHPRQFATAVFDFLQESEGSLLDGGTVSGLCRAASKL